MPLCVILNEMGVCQSQELVNQARVNKVIDHEMVQHKRRTNTSVRLLLLGAGGCGKSTILKQMQLMHAFGFTEEEVSEKRPIIYSNVIKSMAILLEAMEERNIHFEREENQAHKDAIKSVMEHNRDREQFSPAVQTALTELWSDRGVVQCYEHRSQIQLQDSAKYFLDNVDRIAEADYRPTEQDILRARVPTTGVNQITFNVHGIQFRVFDVGGQRNERRKWIHFFDNVNATIFIAAISEYDQVLDEDLNTNRLQESLDLFGWISNHRCFQKTSTILFLNKKDIFEEKIKQVPLKTAFPCYTGGQDYAESLKHMEATFVEKINHYKKQVKCHATCATDSNQVQSVINGVFDILIDRNMDRRGL